MSIDQPAPRLFHPFRVEIPIAQLHVYLAGDTTPVVCLISPDQVSSLNIRQGKRKMAICRVRNDACILSGCQLGQDFRFGLPQRVALVLREDSPRSCESQLVPGSTQRYPALRQIQN